MWLLLVPRLVAFAIATRRPNAGDRDGRTGATECPRENWTGRPQLSSSSSDAVAPIAELGASETSADLIVWPEAPAPIYYNATRALPKMARLARNDESICLLIGTVAETPRRRAAELGGAVVARRQASGSLR